jgi:hypothetical protein
MFPCFGLCSSLPSECVHIRRLETTYHIRSATRRAMDYNDAHRQHRLVVDETTRAPRATIEQGDPCSEAAGTGQRRDLIATQANY